MMQYRVRQTTYSHARGGRRFSRPFTTIRCSASLSSSVKTKVHPITPKPLLSVDASTGFIINEASLSKVPEQWCDLLKGISAAYKEACGPNLVGVYLRGSLPKGFFIPNVSDVDTFALVLHSNDVSNVTINSNSDAYAQGTAGEPLGLQQQQEVAARLAGVWAQKYQHVLAFSKVEVRVLPVAHSSLAAAKLQQHLAAAQQHSYSDSNDSSSVKDVRDIMAASLVKSHDSNRDDVALLTPSMVPSIPAAFELKTQSVCLAGVDLPALLPAAAAHPPAVQLLPELAEDVAAARDEAATAALIGDIKRQIIAAKWALKRLMRCAFELVQPQAGVWTRDLYWCCHYASQYLPRLQQQLQQALELYVQLQQQQQRQTTCDHPQQQEGLQRELAAAWELVDRLSSQIETQFLKNMLTEEPGWLTKHIACPVPTSSCTTTHEGTSRAEATLAIDGQEQQRQRYWPWSAMQNKLQNLAASAGLAAPPAAAVGAIGQPLQLLGAAPPQAQIPIWGKASAYSWSDEAARAAACWHIQSVLFKQRPGHTVTPIAANTAECSQQQQGPGSQSSSWPSSPSSSNRECQHAVHHHDELFCCHPQPLVLQGLAAGWPAVSGLEPWDLAWLSRQGFSGRVRAAPSLQFPFVEPQLIKLLQQIAGLAAAPSLEFHMSTAEFVQRLQPACQLPPLLYTPHEHYYMQAELSVELQQELGLQELMHHIKAASSRVRPSTGTVKASNSTTNNGSCNSSYAVALESSANACVANSTCDGDSRAAAQGSSGTTSQLSWEDAGPVLQFSQAPRIWISPAGAVSPLHYDTSDSFLVQIRGYKRMLFFSPDQLYRLYCYPDTHLLRRRSRVNVAAIDFDRFPLFKDAGALEVVLGPGDCVFFPSVWAHYTESLGEDPNGVAGCSISVTFRL